MPPPRYRLRQLLADLRAPTLSPRATVFLETSRLIALLIFIATVASIVLISYVGVSTVNQPVMPGQIANIRLTASADFSYVSQEKTRQSRERLTDRIPPVYRLDQAPFQRFASALLCSLLLSAPAFDSLAGPARQHGGRTGPPCHQPARAHPGESQYRTAGCAVGRYRRH